MAYMLGGGIASNQNLSMAWVAAPQAKSCAAELASCLLLEKVNKMLQKRVTTSFSLRNYLLPQKRYAKSYNKYFFRI
jgi:hypothetical protein